MTDDCTTVLPEMAAHIRATLDCVAREEDVRILFAAESGSRAWGFASPDSDYDVRFIYVHPRAWYLSLVEDRDVIERPLDSRLVDLAGWDLRKALRLFLKSNPAFYEWLTSPIVYFDDDAFGPAARALFERHADLDVLAHAYHSVANGQLSGDRDSDIKLKRYFYAIRPLLALQWIYDKQTLPPMSLQHLMGGVCLAADVRDAILDLLNRKQATPEIGKGPRIAVLETWIADGLADLDPAQRPRARNVLSGALGDANALLVRVAGL
ncbi:MAG: nucleotidyltransferase domain-containing protein [Hyphomicrobium sp.]